MSVNTTWYMSSVGYTAVTAWATGATVAVGAFRRPSAPTTANERVVICIVAGTTHATTEPTWTTTKGAKNTDNTVTWQEVTGQPAVNGDLTNTPLSSSVRSTNPGLGQIIKNNSATHLFICSTAGTCGAGEPTYSTTAGNTTVDSGATWTCIGAVGSFTAGFAAPFSRIERASATNWPAAGDTIYVASNHAETQAAAVNLANGFVAGIGLAFICVNSAGSFPPVAADITTGASISTTGANQLAMNGTWYFQGITFNAGDSTSATTMQIGGTAGNYVRLENCALVSRGTTSVNFQLGAAGRSKVELVNTTIRCSGSATWAIAPLGHVIWRDTPSAISKEGTNWPNNLIQTTLGSSDFLIENVDLSAASLTRLADVNSNYGHRITFNRCKLPSGTVFSNSPQSSPAGPIIDVIACDTGTGHYKHSRDDAIGRHFTDTTVIRTGGASDGTTGYSWRYVTGTTCKWWLPFDSMPIAVWNSTTAADVTVTLEGVWNSASRPNNDEVWLETTYPGTSGETTGKRKSQTKANWLTTATALSASTEAWDSGATARANTTAYALGDVIKLASNPGRIFFCTTAGTTAGSEPGGYASAVDGGSVTDNTAVFRAGQRFKLAVTLTSTQPQYAGYLNCIVRVGRASTTLLYVDPKPTMT